ncbi:matrixin family metalloprotease [Streptomyces brevispora]|uniref:matrixin family metalloprotease n=1 Tax=Streptomyces brevispora TaxID=887462 RepID=UPI002E2FE6C4|nr:matrixin family metalloprotease [Streptomyces brevispora]
MNGAFLGDGKKYGNKAARRKAAAHEMGHALGLDHKANGTLMAKTMGHISSDARPTTTDRNDYHALWD